MSVELKIKTKSLASEAKIIRKEERKHLANARWRRDRQKDSGKSYGTYNLLNIHRTRDVREEARATFLARAFIKGQSRDMVEIVAMEQGNALHDRLMLKATGMVNRYGNGKKVAEFEAWARN